tara:strand:+ start:44 stop:379 length:336 start_codon:yes stop_codon:yes gene_type:complete
MTRILSLISVILVMGCGPEGPPDDGPYEIYHENGQLMMKGTFKDGELDGPYEFYYENGQLDSKGTMKDRVLDGPVESYYDNGELSYKGTYKDDEECGEWIEDGETVTYDPC